MLLKGLLAGKLVLSCKLALASPVGLCSHIHIMLHSAILLLTTMQSSSSSATLPHEVFDVVLSFLTGFDLLRLSHTDPTLFRDRLSEDSDVWTDRANKEEPCPRAETWLEWLNPSNPQDPRLKAKYKRFVGGLKDDVRTATSKPPSLRRQHCWKKFYFTNFSLQFQGLECGPLTRSQRGAAAEVPSGVHTAWSTESFSFDLWFALRPADTVSNRHYGGILLGAQSVHWIDNWWPEYHEQIAHVDTRGNLYCSVAGVKKIVGRNLQAETWYHLALTYEHRPEDQQGVHCVFVNGQLVDTATGLLPQNWNRTKYLQVGSGCISGSSPGKPTPDHSGWYGFNGLMNECRLWKGALSQEQVQLLRDGQERVVCDATECTWSLKQDDDAFFYGGVTCVQSTRPQEGICIDVRKRFVLPGPEEPFEPRPQPHE